MRSFSAKKVMVDLEPISRISGCAPSSQGKPEKPSGNPHRHRENVWRYIAIYSYLSSGSNHRPWSSEAAMPLTAYPMLPSLLNAPLSHIIYNSGSIAPCMFAFYCVPGVIHTFKHPCFFFKRHADYAQHVIIILHSMRDLEGLERMKYFRMRQISTCPKMQSSRQCGS